MANTKTEVLVIGAGPAGYPCAIRLTQLGKKVTVVEREYMGGVCLNVGCIPSKALIHVGNTYEKMSHAESMGIEVKGAKPNMTKVMEYKDSVVKKLTTGVEGLLKANGCTIVRGDAKFTSPRTVEVKGSSGTQTIEFDTCVIATGSRPAAIKGLEADNKVVLDSTGALAQDALPKTMLCIGGGYIGLELGTFYAKMGVKVTVVEAMPALLGTVDADLTRVVERKLKKMGVEVLTKTKVASLEKGKNSAKVKLQLDGGKEETREFDRVLVTIGRTPNTDGLGLEKAGIRPDAKGFLEVDAQRRTKVPHIFAIGDVAGQPLLAHKGTKEGLVAAEAIAGKKTVYDVVAMPAVVFTDPEIATVGLTEAQAREQGIDAQVGSFPFVANGRALSVSEPDGLVKMVGDRKTGRLLGVHIVGAEASNLIAEAALALEMGATIDDLALTVHAHPTLPETLMEAAEVTLGHPIHIFQRKPSAASARPQANA